MGITFQIDASKLNQKVLELAAVMRRDTKAVMQQEMGLLVKRCMELTAPPHGKGGGTAAKKQGEGAVRRDVNRVFLPMMKLADKLSNQGLRERLKKVVNAGDVEAVRKILSNMNSSDLQYLPVIRTASVSYQSKFRNNRGVVPRRTQQTAVTEDDSILSVMKNLVSHVGRAKAGWLDAALFFGSKGTPAWVSRHGKSDGSHQESVRGDQITLAAINRNKAIGSLDQTSRIVRNAVAGRERDVAAKIKQILDKAASKFNSK